MSILILDNYDSFTYNLYQMLQAQTDQLVHVYRNDALSWPELLAFRPSAVVLSPGPGHPANPADLGLCREVIARQGELDCPILGVCLGHQALIHEWGGVIEQAPAIMHGKTSQVRQVRPNRLLEGLPSPFTVMRYHSWTVSRPDLPDDFEVIAETDEPEPLVMAVQHKHRPLYGVQFHPESIGTPEGGRLLRNFLVLGRMLSSPVAMA